MNFLKIILTLFGLPIIFVKIGFAAPTTVYFENFDENLNSPLTYFANNWGEQVDPSNFSNDSTQFYSKGGSFKIHKPVNVNDYAIVRSDSNYVIRPMDSTRYVLSFWAKANQLRQARFLWTAYQQIWPESPSFIGAKSPGIYNIEVSKDWKYYEFQLQEGYDFFRETQKYILPTWQTTLDLSEDATLWIDDVRLTQEYIPGFDQAIDPNTLTLSPLAEDFTPANENQVRIQIDINAATTPVNKKLGGVSLHRVSGYTEKPYSRQGTWNLTPEEELATRDLTLPGSRIYNLGSDSWQLFSLQTALDKAAEWANRVGVPQSEVVLELEPQDANSSFSPIVWADAVTYSQQKGYGFNHWEIGNETFGADYFGPNFGQAFPNPQIYADHVISVSNAIKAVQPLAKIGLSIAKADTKWGSYLFSLVRNQIDFVVPHFYAFADFDHDTIEEVIIDRNLDELKTVQKINALSKNYSPLRPPVIRDTEWSLAGAGYLSAFKNTNLLGSLHRLYRLLNYVRNNLLDGASAWQLHVSPISWEMGLMSSPTGSVSGVIKYLPWYLHSLFNQFLGTELLKIYGSTPFYHGNSLSPYILTQSTDRTNYFLIGINASQSIDLPTQIDLSPIANIQNVSGKIFSHFVSDPFNASGEVLTDSDAIRSLNLTLSGNSLNWTTPAHSGVFIKITRVIPDNTLPLISITSPSEGSVVRNSTVTVRNQASDDRGVARVELYVDNILKGNSTTAPYSINWNPRNYSIGSHRLQSRAIDTSGNVGLSNFRTVFKR